MSRILTGALSLLLCAASAAAAEATFTAKPTAVRSGDGVKIAFAVSALIDVEVAILDAKGLIVRHLAAGVLGKNPPPPLKPDSLEQALLWDGRDDDGQPATGGPFQVRVGLGLTAAYAGVAFAEPGQTGPNRLESVMGLAVGPDGRVYVLDRVAAWLYWRGSKLHVFRRDGAYEQTIKPFPANLPLERVAATGAFINSFGHLNPTIQRPLHLNFYTHEDVPQQLAVTRDGRIVLAVRSSEGSDTSPGAAALGLIDTEGGVPEADFAGPSLGAAWGAFPCLAAAPDGTAVYFVGLSAGRGAAPSRHALYRVGLPGRGPAEPIFGDPNAAGNDQTHLNDPRAVAVDGQGRLFVADFGNNRVLILKEKDRSVAGVLAVDAPTWVAVHPKSGAVYVASKRERVIKFNAPLFSGGGLIAQEAARLELGGLAANARTSLCLALDVSAEPPVLWVGGGGRLLRAEDRGAAFTDLTPADYFNPPLFWRPASDPTGRLVACRVDRGSASQLHILDEVAGTTRLLTGEIAGGSGRTHRLGPDGKIYAVDHYAGVIRFDRDGKFLPFAATAQDPELRGRLPAGNTGTTCWERDFSVDRKGDIYARKRGPEYHGLCTVNVYGQDGQLKRTVLWTVSDGLYGPHVDPQGNLYVMEAIHPIGRPYPEEFNGRFTLRSAPDWCAWIYGSVIKFSPRGGAVWFAGGQASPVDFDGWRVTTTAYENVAPKVKDLRTTGGALTGQIVGKTATVSVPLTSLNADAVKRLSFRLKNASPATRASLYFNLVGEPYGSSSKHKSIAIRPQSDFAEYILDLSDQPDWKGHVRWLALSPADDAASGSFALDWFKVGDGPDARTWTFDAEDSIETKLPADLPTEKVGSYHRPDENVLQGALWWRFGFSPLGDMGRGRGDPHCHCTGSDFGVDNFGRIFAPDTGRFRIGVLDTNGNEITSFGGYGNQDFCGPESYVLDSATKVLRPRKTDDPKDLVSRFAKPDLAFAWIVGLAVTDRHVYVDDVINKRVLRARLTHAAQETCAVP